MRFLNIIAILVIAYLPQMAQARPYQTDYAQSHVKVSGTHTGKAFTAVFEKWEAVIDFDPAALAQSSFSAHFYPETLKSGNKMYDGTIPAQDWFNVKSFPEAQFHSTAITHKEGNTYHLSGELTIRDVTQPISFDFAVSDLGASPVIATAAFDINRLDFDLGKGSDPAGEWVSKTMTIALKIIASPQ